MIGVKLHQSVMNYVQSMVNMYDLKERSTLEVGSRNVNGSVREFFNPDLYVGIDIEEGIGVDQTINVHHLPSYVDMTFGCVVCTEMLEHDSNPWKTFQAIHRVLVLNGVLILTTRGWTTNHYGHTDCFPTHEYPQDNWRFSVNGLLTLAREAGLYPLNCSNDPDYPGVFLTARK